MPYTKQEWVDLPSHTTPISAERLNHIEDGIEAAAVASDVATDIADVVADFNAALATVNTAISAEATVRASADTTLTTNLTNLSGVVADLSTTINDETADRIEADADLQANIDQVVEDFNDALDNLVITSAYDDLTDVDISMKMDGTVNSWDDTAGKYVARRELVVIENDITLTSVDPAENTIGIMHVYPGTVEGYATDYDTGDTAHLFLQSNVAALGITSPENQQLIISEDGLNVSLTAGDARINGDRILTTADDITPTDPIVFVSNDNGVIATMSAETSFQAETADHSWISVLQAGGLQLIKDAGYGVLKVDPDNSKALWNDEPLATEDYVDTAVGGVDLSTKVSRAGDTMSGTLQISDGNGVYLIGPGAYPNTSSWDPTSWSLNHADGTGGTDSDVNIVPGEIGVRGLTADAQAIGTRVNGEGIQRFRLRQDGKMSWGGGSAVPDATLYRSGVGELKTDGNLVVDGDLLINGAIAATQTFATTADALKVSKTGDTMTGALILDGSSLADGTILSITGDADASLNVYRGHESTEYVNLIMAGTDDGAYKIDQYVDPTLAYVWVKAGENTAYMQAEDGASPKFNLSDDDGAVDLTKNSSNDLLMNGAAISTKNNAIAMAIALG